MSSNLTISRLILSLGFAIGSLLCSSCTWKGGWGRSAKSIVRLQGNKRYVITVERWIHPHVFVGTDVRDGDLYEANYYLVENLRGFEIDEKGIVHVPAWVYGTEDPDWTYSADIPDWIREERPGYVYFANDIEADKRKIDARAALVPAGTKVTIMFPLHGLDVAGRDEPADVRSYKGYLVRIIK